MKTKLLLLTATALVALPGAVLAQGSWLLNGNSGTTPGTNFLGTTDDQPLEFRVNNTRGLLIELKGGSPNLIGGYVSNFVGGAVQGATIGGGGYTGRVNSITASFGTIGGGYSNSVTQLYGTVSGGTENTAGSDWSSVGGGYGNSASGREATVSGGTENSASGRYTVISGGFANTATNFYASVGGGVLNISAGNSSVVGGGQRNLTSGDFAAVGGGFQNVAAGSYSVVPGGHQNNASGSYTTISGGSDNAATNEYASVGGGRINTSGGIYSVVGGGRQNAASADNSVVGGGYQNNVHAGESSIGGGRGNTILTGAYNSSIAGGLVNTIDSPFGAVGGGYQNEVRNSYSTIGGGQANVASGFRSVVGGGYENIAGGTLSAVGGGFSNDAPGQKATVPGGENNTASGDYSFAAGINAQANHRGTFVWSDATSGSFGSAGDNQFLIRASGGVGIGKNNPEATLDVAGKVKCQVLELAGADLAEKFDIAGEVRPGMVVCPDREQEGKLRCSSRAYDRSVVGVVSGAGGINSGILLHQPQTAADGEHPVAMTGRVYVWVDATLGAIEPGDELTTSSTPGHAMKVADDIRANRAVLGTALSRLKEGKGLVLTVLQRR